MGHSRYAWVRLAVAAAVLALIITRLGTGPFVTGLHAVDGWSLAGAGGIAMITTACCAWRWCLVARGVGAPLRFSSALAAYYRSQFLNGTLPGGILGDLHRGVRHGRDAGDLGRGLRAVAWERAAGQVVQVAVAVVVLSAVASPVRGAMPIVLGVVVMCAAAIGLLLRLVARPSWWRTPAVRTAVADVRDGVLARWPAILGTSLVAIAGHTATFVIALRATGSPAPLRTLLPLAVLVLLVAGLPTNIGGWGPREGAAAWAFASAGLGAAQGVAAATAYGALAAAATLPGALVLVAGWFGSRAGRSAPAGPVVARPRIGEPVGVGAGGGNDG